MNKLIQRFSDDSFLTLTTIITCGLSLLHLYQYHDSGIQIEPLVRFSFCITYPFLAFFFGRTGSYLSYFAFANYLTLTNTFTNYTPFVIITILAMLLPRFKIALFSVYIAEMFAVATLHGKTPVHCFIHILNCGMIFYALNYLLKPSILNKKLVLTPDEIIILDELCKGKQQKEIEQFSQNTVTNKLKQARERNRVATTDELILRYRNEN